MSTPTPTLLSHSTRVPPTATRSPPHSPSRSPLRKAQFTAQEIDPLLENLSPTSTIKALSLTEALSTIRPKDADDLGRSVAEASRTERAYGIRAAVAAQKLREWHAEVQGWKWPAKKDRRLGNGFQPTGRARISPSNARQKEYMGSLPTTVVAQHEGRIEEIKDGLEALNVEELKEHVLSAHARSSSQDATADGVLRGWVHLSDFTAVITQTMLQALPYLVKLTALLDDWDARIVVLKQVPHLSRQLSETETVIESAMQNVCSRRTSGVLTRTCFEETKAVLGSDVSRLGAIFDKMLDLLEGREDSLPDSWIHRMDKLEAKFAQWAVDAERMVLNHELTEQNWKSTPRRKKNSQASNTLNCTTAANEDLSSTDPQAQSSTGSEEEVKSRFSARPESKHSRSRALVRADQRSKGDDCNTSSVGVMEAHPAKSGAASDSSFPGHGKDGWPLSTGSQPILTSAATTHWAISPRAPQRIEEDISDVTSQELKSSLIATNHTTTGKGLSLTALAKDKAEVANQPRMLAKAPGDSSRANGDALDQPGAAPLDGAVKATVISQQDLSSVERNSACAPAEELSKYLDQRVDFASGYQSSGPIRRRQTSSTTTVNLTRTNHHRQISEVSVADSALSEPFSDLSTAEIADATTAAALGSPRIVSHPVRASGDDLSNCFGGPKPRTQWMHFQRCDMPPTDPTGKGHRKAASMSLDKMRSSCALPVKTSDTGINGVDDDVESPEVMADQPTPRSVLSQRTLLHRASISSMEKVPKTRIRSIIVNGRGSSSSSIASPISPLDMNEPYTRTDSAGSVSPLESRSSTSPSSKSPRRDYFQGVGRGEERAPTTGFLDWQYSRTMDDHIDTHGITRRPSKLRSHGLSTDTMATWSTDSKEFAVPAHPAHEPQDVQWFPRSCSTATSSVKGDDDKQIRTPSRGKDETHEDLLESKIQRLLTRIPARIRLLSDSGPESPPFTSITSSRSQSPLPSIILSPVKSKRYLQTSRSSTGNSDIRLFHLSRSTESHGTPPTKLFVRLAGEHGERVMVRVGGGWADLGDYLRDYSLHHTKRSLDDGQFELASLPASGPQGRKDSRVIHVGPELISKARTAAPVSSDNTPSIHSRPGSATDHRPSAATPFGVLRPMRHRRSASAIAMHQSKFQDSGQSSSAYAFPSAADKINRDSDPPPVPSIPQIRSLNPYFGNDPRSSGPSRQLYPPASSRSPSALTPSHDQLPQLPSPTSTSSSSQQHRRHDGTPDSAGTGSARSKPAKQPKMAETKSRSTAPATGRGALDPADFHAPAPNISRTYLHSSPTGGSSITASPVPGASPLGDVGGIRRVFFRKKAGA
jgi:Growth-Arrest-Specific Protein 2 Domain